jgi:hypothetical protein
MKPCFRSFGVVFGVSGASEEAGGRLFRPSSRVVTHCVPGPKLVGGISGKPFASVVFHVNYAGLV